uniref:DNA topoisomerase n=1 Tax=Glycine max TaxID=3847 RepID=A0A0R0JHI3_SOYBN
MNVLNVAEKPMVARTVATILSRNQNMRMREGRSRYNKIFEFNYTIRGQPCHMIFTSVTGHLMELEFDDRYRKWHSCDPADLFRAPVHKFVPEDKKDIKRTLEEEARRCQWLILWLDCDVEGENIAYEVIDVCTAVNPHLTIKRAWFSTLIDRDIHNAAQNDLRDPDKRVADAVDVRQEIDLRIGASFTRFQTMLMKDAFIIDTATDDRNRVLSYGPCQFPTLGFVVERFWEIQAHEPEEFWSIICSHESKEGTAEFSWMRGRLFDYTCAVIIYEMCVEEPTATVTNIRQQEKPKYPPFPLNTIELQKRASRYFRMSSDHTMKVAEELYQAGFISYPRTETDSFSPGTDLHTIVQEQQGHPEWGIYAQRLMDPEAGLWRNPRGGGHDDKAHPPIYPTKFSTGESGWSQDHRKLYELVVRHFLACVSKPALGAETTVEINIAGELFSACGRVILEKNYLDVYRYESWGGSMIPTYTNGQQFNPTKLTLESGVTRPPPLLSEADLLSYMDREEAKIGTDATMQDHIKKMLDRSYATKDSSTRFTPTNLGEALVLGYDDIDMTYKLWKPDLRSEMEKKMDDVKKGDKSKAEVLVTILQKMEACFLEVSMACLCYMAEF